MTSQEKASWIRRIFTLFLILIAAGAGLYFAMPKGGWGGLGKQKSFGQKVIQANYKEMIGSPNKLTVLNVMVNGNGESATLQGILENLEKERYHDKVVMAELNVNEQPAVADWLGVERKGFAGHLDFYANGRKLEQLVGETDAVVVEKTIDRLLAGLVQRISRTGCQRCPA